MTRSIAIMIATLIVAAISTAQAQEVKHMVGPLEFSCGKWVNTAKNTPRHEVLKTWIFGYLSGVNVAMAGMEAPKCIVCGTRHWSRQPCPASKTDARKLAAAVTKPQATSVTKPANVTKLKGGRLTIGDKAMSAAERARRYRQRKTTGRVR